MEPPSGGPFVQVEVHAPASTVWDVLSDISAWKDVITGIDDIVFTGGESALKPGLAWDETRVMFGRSETEHIEIVDVDPIALSMKSKSESCGTLMEFYHRVLPSGEGEEKSVLEMYFSAAPLTWTAWAFQWTAIFTRGMMRKVMLQDLMDVKNAAEKS